jgi:peptidoglycan/LPS O-acetylase OafA/YrhL
MLIPAGQRDYYLGVEWTLVFECAYYLGLFFVALIGWHRYLNRILLIWIAVIAAAPLFIGWSDKLLYPFYSIWLSPANAAFIGGLLIPSIANKIRIPVGIGIIGLCIFVFLGNSIASPMINRWSVGVMATWLVLDVARIDIPRRAVAGLSMFGDWSYALYLCHVPIILIVYRWWPSSTNVGMAWLIAVAAALIVAAGFGMLDVRTYRHLKSAVDNDSEERRRRFVNIYACTFVFASLLALLVK